MTFEYRDADGGHLSVTPLPGVPYVLVRTDPEGCAVPADLVPDMVAGIRDTTRTAAARQTTGQDDTDCGLPEFAGCECNHLTGCEHPAPAVGQPAEAPATNEAHPPREQWVIEWYRKAKGEWLEDQPAYNYRDDAFDEIARQRRHNPARQLRLVRETTTWTVEDETR